MNFKNPRFQKKNYRHLKVSEVKKEFGKDVKKYMNWEIEIFLHGLYMTGDLKAFNKMKKHKKEAIEHILKKDEEIVQNALLDYLNDLTREES